jgi:hypothetical protein
MRRHQQAADHYPASRADGPSEFSVYSGQDCLGHAVERQPGKWTAFTAEDKALGTYPNRRAATDAIIGHRVAERARTPP